MHHFPPYGCHTGTYDQSGECVYTMSLCGDKLVVGTSNRKVKVEVEMRVCDQVLVELGSSVGLEKYAVCRAEASIKFKVPDTSNSLFPQSPGICA